MSDTCKMRIKIADNPTYSIDYYGFYLAKSPSELGCDVKESNIVTTDFPESDGDAAYIPSTVSKKSFDYTISLIFFDNNLNTANKKISEFYNSLLGKKVTLFNDYKGVKIVGYVKSYKAGEFYRNEKDVVVFDLTFFVPKPGECDFDYAASKYYFGTTNSLASSTTRPFTMIIQQGATFARFLIESSLGGVVSVIYNELGYEIKDIFEETSADIENDDGSVTEYTQYTYTPAIPFSKQVTYTVK